ncbi:Bax inhibitor-1/YccA family protein [Aggregicoccus sp. 17bor-14]|nr:Bax inhibitor-1/YccA family protein [Simulacricoccus sp. 17bor-14]MRI87072.1 Bax inhibitor-1/YccA family protein [Aggregicoccus sp. 17bor-14]
MARVYRQMFMGLALTGLVALYTASNASMLRFVLEWRWGIFAAQIGTVLLFSGLARRLSGGVAEAVFLGYSALTGLTMSFIFLVYQLGSIGQVFLISSATFLAMSVYANVTKKDLSTWGTFLMMGLVGIVLAGIANIFIKSEGLSFVGACAGVLVFAGLTAYDTQKLKALHADSGYSSSGAVSTVGALELYLDFVNLFLSLLRLLGRRR